MNRAGDASARDELTAYELLIQHLPRPSLLEPALQTRHDGSTAQGVIAVIDRVKMEFYARIGDLRVKLEQQDV